MIEHIQINDVAPRVQYLADGIQSAFTFPFAIFKLADLEVWLDDSLQASGYTVSGVGVSTGGVALFAVPPPADTRVTLRRRLTIARTTDYQSDGLIRAKTLNDELDYQVAALQQVAEDVDRAVRRAPTALAAIDLTLPEPAAGRGLKWNAGGTALVNSTHDPDAVGDATQAASQAMAAAATASLARDQAVAAAASLDNPLSAMANLADVDDAALARVNLGVPAAADLAVSTRDEETAVALDDQVLLHDQSAGTDRRMQVANLLKAVDLLDTDTSPDASADYVMTWDSSVGAARKVRLDALGGGWEVAGITSLTTSSAAVVISGLDTSLYEYKVYFEEVSHSSTYPSSNTLHVVLGYGAVPTYGASYNVAGIKQAEGYGAQTLFGGTTQANIMIADASDRAYRAIRLGCLHLHHTANVSTGWYPAFVEYSGAYHAYSSGHASFITAKAHFTPPAPISAVKLFAGSGDIHPYGRIRVMRCRITA